MRNVDDLPIERFHSLGQHLCQLVGTKESIYMRKEFNSQGISLVHQYGRLSIVFEHQDVRRQASRNYQINIQERS